MYIYTHACTGLQTAVLFFFSLSCQVFLTGGDKEDSEGETEVDSTGKNKRCMRTGWERIFLFLRLSFQAAEVSATRSTERERTAAEEEGRASVGCWVFSSVEINSCVFSRFIFEYSPAVPG